MESKVIQLVMIALLSATVLKADFVGEEWKASKVLIAAIQSAESADAQLKAVGSFVAEVWKHRAQKVNLKVILCDKQGEPINWSKPGFLAETAASIIVIPQRTDDQLKPFVVIPQNTKVVYAFIRDF